MSIPLGKVHFADEHDDNIVKAWFTETLPTVDDGYGGWETIDRPHDKQLLNWKGRSAAIMTLAIVLDGFATGGEKLVPPPGSYGGKVTHIRVKQSQSVEADVRQLEKFAQPTLNKHNQIIGPPIAIKVNGGGALPHDIDNASHLRWVIQSIDWGDALWDDNGDRIRQAATLTLWEWVEPDEIGILKPKKGQPKDKHRVIKTQKGDTLKTLAKKYLGSANLWRRFRELNPKFTDPNSKIKQNTSMRVPFGGKKK
jgi:hypothetical protein